MKFFFSQCRATTLMRDSKLNDVVFLVNEQNHSEKRNNYAHFPQVWAQAQQFRTAFADRLWFKYPSLHDKSIYFKTWHFPITQGLPMHTACYRQSLEQSSRWTKIIVSTTYTCRKASSSSTLCTLLQFSYSMYTARR